MKRARNFVVEVKRSRAKKPKLKETSQQMATVGQVVAAASQITREANRPLLKMPRIG